MTSKYFRAIIVAGLLILDIMQAVDLAESTSMPGLVISTNLFFLHFNQPDLETSRTEAIFL